MTMISITWQINRQVGVEQYRLNTKHAKALQAAFMMSVLAEKMHQQNIDCQFSLRSRPTLLIPQSDEIGTIETVLEKIDIQSLANQYGFLVCHGISDGNVPCVRIQSEFENFQSIDLLLVKG